MIAGTIFYAIRNELGWPLGFYMMVNVGYSVGWGYPIELDNKCRWYSIINVVIGAIALSYALNVFAQGVVRKSKNWYSIALYESDMNSESTKWTDKHINWCMHHSKELSTILVAILWIMAMTTWGVLTFPGWSFINGFYFAVGSLSTGGMHPIPKDSTQTEYIIGECVIGCRLHTYMLAYDNV
jgi:amino acid transporter